ncbi:MAG: PilZ domain-containing protein [Nitrospira sp.]|nr:PilZ domain-containing protein [Nitrospira sp.]
MPPDRPAETSARERREFYRITVVLPVCIQSETDLEDCAFTEKSINLSGGGIGMPVTTRYPLATRLCFTMLLPDQVRFKATIEVLWFDTLPVPGPVYRLHARFVKMSSQDRELLIRYIVRFQRDHLQNHYSA